MKEREDGGSGDPNGDESKTDLKTNKFFGLWVFGLFPEF